MHLNQPFIDDSWLAFQMNKLMSKFLTSLWNTSWVSDFVIHSSGNCPSKKKVALSCLEQIKLLMEFIIYSYRSINVSSGISEIIKKYFQSYQVHGGFLVLIPPLTLIIAELNMGVLSTYTLQRPSLANEII